MLLSGVHHVAIITNDTQRLVDFYRDVFEALSEGPREEAPGMKLTFIHVGPLAELNVFEIAGELGSRPPDADVRAGADRPPRSPAESIEAFETVRERLIARGAAGRVRDRLRSRVERLLPRPGRARGRGLRRQPRRGAGPDEPTRDARGGTYRSS